MSFSLAEAACLLIHKNDRIEKHGDEDKLACDINLSFETNNGILAMFSPTLRSCLYMKADSDQSSLVPDVDHLTALRNPALAGGKPFHWATGDLVGAELRFHHGIESKSDVVFNGAKIGKFKLECKEGGTVIVHFQAQVYPEDLQMTFLSKALRNKICTVSITPPDEF